MKTTWCYIYLKKELKELFKVLKIYKKSKCLSKCSGSNLTKECVECLQDNGCDEFHCIEGHTSEIILIIIISLTGIFLLFKLFCMFQKKGSMAMM